MKTKSETIRDAIRKWPDADNQEIKAYAKSQGHIVESNLIWSVCGGQRERIGQIKYGPDLQSKAEQLIKDAGSLEQARRLLYVVAGGM
jgi:hypothetical protein